MVQGRQRVKSYKIHTQEQVPESEWYIVENTHEPIIERPIFEKMQELLSHRSAEKEALSVQWRSQFRRLWQGYEPQLSKRHSVLLLPYLQRPVENGL